MNDLILLSENRALIADSAKAAKEFALEKAALVGVVKGSETQEFAIVALREVKGVLSEVEKARKKVKAPVLDLAAAIDAAAKTFGEELKSEELRISTLIGDFQQAELARAREAEVARQRELERIENERREAEYQLRKKAEDEARAVREAEEKARREAEEKARKIQAEIDAAAKLTGKAAAEEKARLEREAAEAKRIEFDRQATAARAAKLVEDERRANEIAIAARAAQDQEQIGGPVLPTVAAGQSSKPTFDYEVVDVWTLTRSNPGFVKPEPIRSAILAAINEHGVKEIKGLRIFEVIKTRVTGRMQKTIDV